MEAYEGLNKIEQMIVQIYLWCSNATMSMSGSTVAPFLKWEDGEAMLVVVNAVYEWLIIFGVGMLIIYFLAELNKTLFMAGNNMTMQHIFNPLIKLAAGYIVITKGGTIIGYFLSFCNGWVTWITDDLATGLFGSDHPISGYNPTDGQSLTDICDMIEGMGMVGAVVSIVPMIVMLLLTIVISVVFIYKALIWKIELGFRLALAPISLGDIYDGKNGNAVRYLKKILSMVLYAGGMVLVLKLGTALYMSMSTGLGADVSNTLLSIFEPESGGLLDTIMSAGGAGHGGGASTILAPIMLILNLLIGIIIPLAELGCMKAVKQICDDALG